MVAVMTISSGLPSGSLQIGEAADHRIGRQVHDGGEHDQAR